MKSKNKILAVTAFAMLSLMGCNIDPILTDSYSEDVAWSNVDNLRLNLNGFYSLMRFSVSGSNKWSFAILGVSSSSRSLGAVSPAYLNTTTFSPTRT